MLYNSLFCFRLQKRAHEGGCEAGQMAVESHYTGVSCHCPQTIRVRPSFKRSMATNYRCSGFGFEQELP